jgi:soluble lytic murein transglycosylase-like protein
VLEHKKLIAKAMLCLCVGTASAGPQREEHLGGFGSHRHVFCRCRLAAAHAVFAHAARRAGLPAVAGRTAKPSLAQTRNKKGQWRLPELSSPELQLAFLQTVWYESQRAALEPSLVLGLIEVESGFRKFAISSAGARGAMQVMPFWTRQLGHQGTRRCCFSGKPICALVASSCATICR